MYLRIIFLLLFLPTFIFCKAQNEFEPNSVLKSGSWYKAKVNKSGIYKITFNKLVELGFETPENLRIYSNSGRQLSYQVDTLAPDDLVELPLYAGENYFVFYAEGPGSWELDEENSAFISNVHDYATSNYLFLTTSFGVGKRIETKDYSNLSTNINVSSYSWRDYYEEELYNPIQTGRTWFGEKFDKEGFEHTFSSIDYIPGSDFKLNIGAAARSEFGGTLKYYFNGDSIAQKFIYKVDMNSHEGSYGNYKEVDVTLNHANSQNIFKSEFFSSGVNDEVYIDYVFANTTCQLNYTSSPFFFRDIKSYQAGGNAVFELSNVQSGIQVWNVSDIGKVFGIKGTLGGGIFQFKSPLENLNEFVALDPTAEYPVPVFMENDQKVLGWMKENQNLHAMSPPELLIVTHPLFKEPADSLAEIHRLYDNMNVSVVTTEQIYNEFSSGMKDASAIRNFARMLWLKSQNTGIFKYILLFGDGTYDNRNEDANNMNYIPTYQSKESLDYILNQTSSYSSDDIYGQLEVGEFSISGTLDVGVGRLPVNWSESDENATSWGIIKKIIQYYSFDVKRDWRNRMIFLADDMESNWERDFVDGSEELIDIVKKKAPEINFTKIYLDAFTSISSSTGASYPEVEDAIHEAFNKGALFFNYMGHGGENGITQERVLQSSDFENLRNAPIYPIFITATCQVSRFDNVDISDGIYTRRKSAGEAALLNPKGGAIALLTTTRLVYQSANKRLSRSVFNAIFDTDSNGRAFRLGDMYRKSKNTSSTLGDINNMKFSLLGDPSLPIPYARHKVSTDSLNKIAVNSQPDTLIIDTINALGHVIITGHICNDSSEILSDFDGIVQISVFDKEYSALTKANKPNAEVIEFMMQDRLLFRGNASVKKGFFSAEFIIPKDISYNFGKGRITYYAYNESTDAKGEFDMFLIGGTSDLVVEDFDGPEIELYMNNEDFLDGGITDPNPLLLANVYDENGINTTGNGIGHDVSAFMDNNYSSVLSLNDYFEGQLDDYKRGVIKYPLVDLEPGYHTINLKVWDTYNNSSDAEIGFVVEDGDKIIIDKLFNYPNPMNEFTTFQYSHNMPGEHEVRLEIFDLSGKLVYSFEQTNYESGFVSTPIFWNRKESGFITPGVYPYRITVNATSEENNEEYITFQTNKLIIIP